jgi:putative SOS response-associated peptidase YedK
MPVLLSEPEHFDIWLNGGSPDEAFALARPYSAQAMRIVQSGADREDLLRAA